MSLTLNIAYLYNVNLSLNSNEYRLFSLLMKTRLFFRRNKALLIGFLSEC